MHPRVPKEVASDRLKPSWLWWLLAVPAASVAGYALALQDARGLPNAVPGMPWIDEVHFIGGGVALLVGVFAFRRDLLVRKTALHRKIGMTYCTAILISGIAGLLMALYSYGGMTTHLGFGLLAIVWLATTLLGLRAIKRRAIAQHRRWMVRSYAAAYAAVTLRVELPFFAWVFGDFEPAFQTVSWTCWVINLAVAEWWLSRTTVAGVWKRSANNAVQASGAGSHS